MVDMTDEMREALSRPPAYLHYPYQWRWITDTGSAGPWHMGNESPVLVDGKFKMYFSIEAILFNGQRVRYKAPKLPRQPILC